VKLTSPSQVQALLRQRGIQPHGALGQNFLIDANIRDIIVESADPGPDDVILEVGPGLGVLTESLSERAGRVVAVEKDRKLYAYLTEQFAGHPTVTLVHADFLELDPSFLEREGVTKVVSNLPYSVGSRILMDLFALPDPPGRITVTVQLEVGERLAAAPGHAQRGLLGVWAQRIYAVHLAKIISPSCFCPPPKIRSAVMQLDRRRDISIEPQRLAFFRQLTKAAFGFRRKQMATILHRIGDGLGVADDQAQAALDAMGLDPKIRPERLSVDQWQELADGLAARSKA
jgi:16S rRNA (adenine1518-N6/adenine1519-N6)-dimethyltransferase